MLILFLHLFIIEGIAYLGENTSNSYCDAFIVAAGIVVFLLVEKAVRYVEDNSGGTHGWSHGHHHHHDKSSKKLKEDSDTHDIVQSQSLSGKGVKMEMSTEGKVLCEVSNDSSNGHDVTQHEVLRKVRSFYFLSIDVKAKIMLRGCIMVYVWGI